MKKKGVLKPFRKIFDQNFISNFILINNNKKIKNR